LRFYKIFLAETQFFLWEILLTFAYNKAPLQSWRKAGGFGYLISTIKRCKFMKKIVYFTLLSVLSLSLFHCSDETMIAKDNIISEAINESMIEEAERNLGTLYKEKITFTDTISGSKFNFIFAALNKEALTAFFKTNQVKIKGVSVETKKELLKSAVKITNGQNISSSSTSASNTFIENEVYYDLVSKELKGGDVGLSFRIIPKNTETKDNLKSLRPSYSWRQQTSLPWCEIADITPISESPVKYYPLYFQVRGIFWNGSGTPFWSMPTNGVTQSYNIDGPKFTRFGGENDAYDRCSVTWYDLDSGESRTD
jgi:hypothetical protein